MGIFDNFAAPNANDLMKSAATVNYYRGNMFDSIMNKDANGNFSGIFGDPIQALVEADQGVADMNARNYTNKLNAIGKYEAADMIRQGQRPESLLPEANTGIRINRDNTNLIAALSGLQTKGVDEVQNRIQNRLDQLPQDKIDELYRTNQLIPYTSDIAREEDPLGYTKGVNGRDPILTKLSTDTGTSLTNRALTEYINGRMSLDDAISFASRAGNGNDSSRIRGTLIKGAWERLQNPIRAAISNAGIAPEDLRSNPELVRNIVGQVLDNNPNYNGIRGELLDIAEQQFYAGIPGGTNYTSTGAYGDTSIDSSIESKARIAGENDAQYRENRNNARKYEQWEKEIKEENPSISLEDKANKIQEIFTDKSLEEIFKDPIANENPAVRTLKDDIKREYTKGIEDDINKFFEGIDTSSLDKDEFNKQILEAKKNATRYVATIETGSSNKYGLSRGFFEDLYKEVADNSEERIKRLEKNKQTEFNAKQNQLDQAVTDSVQSSSERTTMKKAIEGNLASTDWDSRMREYKPKDGVKGYKIANDPDVKRGAKKFIDTTFGNASGILSLQRETNVEKMYNIYMSIISSTIAGKRYSQDEVNAILDNLRSGKGFDTPLMHRFSDDMAEYRGVLNAVRAAETHKASNKKEQSDSLVDTITKNAARTTRRPVTKFN